MTMRVLDEKEKQASRLRARSGAFVECDVAKLEKELAPYLEEGETMPDVALLMTLALRRLSKLVEELA